jgi:hypothetical protein
VAALIFTGGMLLGVLAPLGRRHRSLAPAALTVGTVLVLAYALFDLWHPDIRAGRAAVDSNRRFDLFTLACELPAALLASVAWARSQKLCFWLGWTLNVGYGVWFAVVLVWLEFFWHW